MNNERKKVISRKNIKRKMTISKIVEMSANKIPTHEIFSFPEVGTRYSFKEFNDKVNEACRSLIAMGAKKGSHIGLWMGSIEEWFILFFAINRIGAVAVPINTGFKSSEMDKILKNFDIDYLFMVEGFKKNYPDHIKKIIPGMKIPNDKYPRLKNIVSIDFSNENCTSYDEFIRNGDSISIEKVNEYSECVGCNDVCIILPTSGTTGLPKGVMLTNGQLIKNGFDIGERYTLNGNDKMLIQVPMFHCFGITLSMLSSLTHCTPMCVISHFNPKVAIKVIENEKITCMNGVPTMYSDILSDSSFSSAKVKTIKKGIMAGSNCLPDFMKEVSDIFGMKIISVYGLSEASPGCTMTAVYDSDEVRYNTVGKTMPRIKCMIVDSNTGEKCADTVRGEFVVKGYNVMMGYYNDQSMTDRSIDSNSFLHTGDVAERRSDGNFVITGRIKDTIIRGGENIYPKEVSMVINSCPGVIDSCVFGVEDKRLQQEVVACVITDGSVSVDEITDYMRDNCAGYKIPRYFFIVDEFIKNAAGKVMVGEMAKTYSKKIN